MTSVLLCVTVGEDELQTRQATAQQNHQVSQGDGGTHSDTTTTANEDTAPIKSATAKKKTNKSTQWLCNLLRIITVITYYY